MAYAKKFCFVLHMELLISFQQLLDNVSIAAIFEVNSLKAPFT